MLSELEILFFDIAKLLKTTILPSRVIFWNSQNFSTVCTLETSLIKLDSFVFVLFYGKNGKKVHKILIASFPRSMQLISQTTNGTSFRSSIPIIWFQCWKNGKLLNISTTIIVIKFWDSFIFQQIFLLLQVKQSVIIYEKHGTYKLPHEFSNDLRL